MREGLAISEAMVRGVIRGEEQAEVEQVDLWAWLVEYAKGKSDCYRAALLSWQRHSEEQAAQATQATLMEWNTWLCSNASGKSAGTAHTYLGCVAAMLHKAHRMKVIDWKAEVERPSLPAKRGKVALDKPQIKALEGLQLSGEQDLVRDLFLLGVYTALRRSDWNLEGSELGTIKNTTKGKGSALIADNDKLRKLLAKHGGHLGTDKFYREGVTPTTNVLQFDKMLGEVMAKLATKRTELNEVVEHRGKRVPKWKAVGSHSGRKTFITKYARMLPLPTVMQASGHKSLAQFATYVQNTVDDTKTAKLFT